MLKKLRLHNFKTFLNTEVSFTQRHLLIGKNNSGKTNLCSAIRFLQATAALDLPQAAVWVPGGVEELTNWHVKSNQIELGCSATVEAAGETLDYEYELVLVVAPSDNPAQLGSLTVQVGRERLTVNGDHFRSTVLLDSDGKEATLTHEENHLAQRQPATVHTLAPQDSTMLQKLYELPTNRRAVRFRQYLAGWAYFALSPDHMRFGWTEIKWPLGGLVPRGDNLATALFQLKNIDEQRYRRLVKHAQKVEPNLRAINFFPAPDQNPVPFLEMDARSRASWPGLSDGTLRFLGICALVVLSDAFSAHGPSCPLVVLEEPENGIHPGLLRHLHDLIEDCAPRSQFVFTSHSPYFINMFDAFRESVTLLRRTGDRTEVVAVPPANADPDRSLLAEQYSMELIG
ncbi:MAG: AAA family ATPase [Phycisphaerae bacterium]|nr:AAA family ATPase [Phycisphaerae bacterium]